MHAFKILALLLTGLGLAGVSCRLATGKCPFGHMKAAAQQAWAELHGQEPHDKVFVLPADEQQTQQTQQVAEVHSGRAHWRERLVAAHHRAAACHMRCAEDKECHAQCPRPWQHFRSRCETMKPILGCHKACGRDHSCHMQCPKPECPHMRAMVEKALECHGTCKPGDFECHRACPKPLHRMAWGCSKLAMKAECHKACSFHDRECHHQCCHKHLPFGHHHGHHFGHQHGHHFGHDHDHDHQEPQWGEIADATEEPLAVAEAVEPALVAVSEAAVVQV